MARHLKSAALALIVAAVLAGAGGSATANDQRLAGAEPAPRLGQPFYASLVVSGLVEDDRFCGASLIGDQWALTATHCVLGEPDDLEVLVGGHSTNARLGAKLAVCSIERHPGFSDFDYASPDIAVLELCEPHHHPTLALPSATLDANAPLTALGYGFDGAAAKPTLPQTASFDVLEDEVCLAAYEPEPGSDGFNPSNSLCTQAADGASLCVGDSGSPLFHEVEGVLTVEGVAAYAGFNCPSERPSVWMWVEPFVPWIQGVTGIERGDSLPGIPCAGRYATHLGTPGDDTIVGSARGDVIVARGGDDVIRSLDGRDAICAGPGDDDIRAGRGVDRILGGAGSDACRGGPGKDTARSCEVSLSIS